jgi:phosphatidylglycerophosphatase A
VTRSPNCNLQTSACLGLPAWHPAAALATWFGIGLLPIAPGTWGSLAALPLAWAICSRWGASGLALAFLVVSALGVWAAGAVARAGKARDPGMVVIDEVAGQWLVLLAAPLGPLPWSIAFLLFRLFDIWKPWPVNWLDRHVEGGCGIMLDDIAAAVYALLALRIGLAIAGASGVRI